MEIKLSSHNLLCTAGAANLVPGDVFVTDNVAYLICQSCWAIDLQTYQLYSIGSIPGRGMKARKATLNVEL